MPSIIAPIHVSRLERSNARTVGYMLEKAGWQEVVVEYEPDATWVVCGFNVVASFRMESRSLIRIQEIFTSTHIKLSSLAHTYLQQHVLDEEQDIDRSVCWFYRLLMNKGHSPVSKM